MSRLLTLSLVILLCIFPGYSWRDPVSHEEAVKKLAEEFGRSLKMVPLLAPGDIVEELMHKHYGNYVTPGLLEEWVRCPLKAPGRVVSSPWPDRIEVTGIRKVARETYEVDGVIVEVTNTEEAARRPVTLVVIKANQTWLIRAVLLLPPGN